MRAPKPEDWLIHRGNYQAWGYSPLEQINKGNVKSLQLVWSRAMEPGINQATPARLQRHDVSRESERRDPGDRCRQRRPPLGVPASAAAGRRDSPATHGQRKRSIALYGDRVFTVTWNNIVVALDARTGEQVWQTDRGGDLYVSNSTGPIVANGVVVAGSTCQVAGFACYVTGHDAETGEELWRNELVPRPGQAGRRDLGRRAVREALDDRRMGTAHLRSRARSRLLRIERRGARLGSAARNAGRNAWPAPTRAGRSGPRPARSCGGIRCCRATTGIRNARSR